MDSAALLGLHECAQPPELAIRWVNDPQPPVTLVCGHCLNRRVLAELKLHPGRAAVVPVATGRRFAAGRPTVDGGPCWCKLLTGEAAELRRRCKRGHPWSIPVADLHRAYLAAVAAGRRDIVAGVDC